MSKISVAVIGNGVVAAFAAAGARDAGASVIMYGPERRIKAPPSGAFYFHELPGIRTPQHPVSMFEARVGDNPRHYAKVMGVERETSIDRMPPVTQRGVYLPNEQNLSELVEDTEFEELFVSSADMLDHRIRARHHSTIITAPVPLHPEETRPQVNFVRVVSIGRLHDAQINYLNEQLDYDLRYLFLMARMIPYVSLYNAQSGHWLRMTKFGTDDNIVLEVPDSVALKHEGIEYARVPKLAEHITPRQSPHPDVLLAGRFATYNRKELSHEAYAKAYRFITERKQR